MHNIHLELEVNTQELYCPVTGIKVFDDQEGFQPSPALVFCYIDEAADFEFALDWIQELYDTSLEATDDEPEEAYDLFLEKLGANKSKNLVCFDIWNNQLGPMENFGKFCFDMNYQNNKN